MVDPSTIAPTWGDRNSRATVWEPRRAVHGSRGSVSRRVGGFAA